MKLLIDTSHHHFFVALIDNATTCDYILEKNLVKKSDILVEKVNFLLSKNDCQVTNLEAIYLTLGPGSFMGARSALVFARTLSRLGKIPLYSASTFALLNFQSSGSFCLAYKNDYYFAQFLNGDFAITLVKNCLVDTIDYQSIVTTPNHFLQRFSLVENLATLAPCYVKDLEFKISESWVVSKGE